MRFILAKNELYLVVISTSVIEDQASSRLNMSSLNEPIRDLQRERLTYNFLVLNAIYYNIAELRIVLIQWKQGARDLSMEEREPLVNILFFIINNHLYMIRDYK